MPKNKKPGDKPTPRKASAKKSPAKEAAPKKSAAEEIATKAPVTAPHLAAESIHLRTAQPSPAELYEEIRRRAYEFYRERGAVGLLLVLGRVMRPTEFPTRVLNRLLAGTQILALAVGAIWLGIGGYSWNRGLSLAAGLYFVLPSR